MEIIKQENYTTNSFSNLNNSSYYQNTDRSEQKLNEEIWDSFSKFTQYTDNIKVKQNYRLTNERTLNEHTSTITCLVKISNTQFASASDDHSIKIWDSETGFCLKNLKEHFLTVNCLIKVNEFELVSGSEDSLIKIWNLKSTEGTSTKTIYEHTGPILCLLKVNNSQLISESMDKTFKMWSWNSNKEIVTCIKTFDKQFTPIYTLINECNTNNKNLTFHSLDNLQTMSLNNKVEKSDGLSLNCLIKLFDSQISSNSEKYSIKIWETSKGTCTSTKKRNGHNGIVVSLIHLNDQKFVTGCLDNSIKIWNSKNGKLLFKITEHTKAVTCLLKLTSDVFASGSCDNSIRIFNAINGVCLKNYENHSSPIICLIKMSDNQIISGSMDKEIKIWDFE